MAQEALNPACPKCGAPVAVPDGASYAHCTFCSSDSFVDLTGAILYQVIRPAIAPSRVAGLVRARARDAGWPRAAVSGMTLIYEPVWELENSRGNRVRIGARPDPKGRFPLIKLPGGERAFVDPRNRAGDAIWLEPELAPESAAEVAARAAGRPISVHVMRLVHRPIYAGKFRIGESTQDLRLDAVNGELLDVVWPARPTFKRRDRAWSATGLMVAVAVLLPLSWATLGVLAVGVLAIREFSQTSQAPRTPQRARRARRKKRALRARR